MARPGTLAWQQGPEPMVEVPMIVMMDRAQFLAHCRARHRELRFVTRENHDHQHGITEFPDHAHVAMALPEEEDEQVQTEDEVQTDEEVMVDLDPPEIPEEDTGSDPPKPQPPKTRRR